MKSNWMKFSKNKIRMESKSQQSILKIHKKFPSNNEFQTKKIDKKLIEQRSSKSYNKFRNALYIEKMSQVHVHSSSFPEVHFNSRNKSVRLSSQSSKYYSWRDFQTAGRCITDVGSVPCRINSSQLLVLD